MEISRRSLITGLTSFVCAPAIVRADSLMRVRLVRPTLTLQGPHKFIPIRWEYGEPARLFQIVFNDDFTHGDWIEVTNQSPGDVSLLLAPAQVKLSSAAR